MASFRESFVNPSVWFGSDVTPDTTLLTHKEFVRQHGVLRGVWLQ